MGNASPNIIDETVKSLIEHEGFRSTRYQDTEGVWTIGHGMTFFTLDELLLVAKHRYGALGAFRLNLSVGDGIGRITKDESLIVLRHRVENECLPQCKKLFPNWKSLSWPRQVVLLNMMYNLGPDRLRGFYKMRAALDEDDYERAADEMLDSKWARQVGDEEDERAGELAYIMRTRGTF